MLKLYSSSGVEMCLKYNIDDAEDFVDQWMSYSTSKCNGDEPTLALLQNMERDDFRHYTSNKSIVIEPKLEPMYTDDVFTIEQDDVMSAYIPKTELVSWK